MFLAGSFAEWVTLWKTSDLNNLFQFAEVINFEIQQCRGCLCSLLTEEPGIIRDRDQNMERNVPE